jgi:hypothetical protein
MSTTAPAAAAAVRKRRSYVITVEVPAVIAAKACLLDVSTAEYVQKILDGAAEALRNKEG